MLSDITDISAVDILASGVPQIFMRTQFRNLWVRESILW